MSRCKIKLQWRTKATCKGIGDTVIECANTEDLGRLLCIAMAREEGAWFECSACGNLITENHLDGNA